MIHLCPKFRPDCTLRHLDCMFKHDYEFTHPYLQVDCTVEVDLCRGHFIMGFPSLRVFRKGHDEINVGGVSTIGVTSMFNFIICFHR